MDSGHTPSNDLDDNQDDDNDDAEEEIDDSNDQLSVAESTELFSCPSQGCILSFKRYLNLENHMAYGKCKLRKESFTLIDKAKMLYAQKLSEGASSQPHLSETTTHSGGISMCKGWALRQAKKSGRFNENQRSYLDERFELGQSTGIKCDPTQVACDLRHARKLSGERRFSINEFLTPQQIKSYFSRKAAKNKQVTTVDGKEIEDIDVVSVEEQTAYSRARDSIIQEFQLTHPIVYDTHNICHLNEKNKLKDLKVDLLHDICSYLNLNVEGLSLHRKKPYLSLITDLVKSCSCNN